MKITVQDIERKFDRFNQEIFWGKLPPVPIELSRAKSFLGMCCCQKHKNFFGKEEKYNFKLRFSTQIDLSEQEFEDTLIHEMIHYYIGINRLKDTAPHGKIFRHLMQSINEQYGRHITISHKLSEEQMQQLSPPDKRSRIVAVVCLRDLRKGIKILPNIPEKIFGYCTALSKHRDIQSVSLYKSDNIFFHRFPRSCTTKIHLLSSEEITKNIVGAKPLFCDGLKVWQAPKLD